MINNLWEELEVSIGDIKTLLLDGYEIEVTSPDGYVSISSFIDKGIWEEYLLILESGDSVRVNENHLFETSLGWQSAKQLSNNVKEFYLTEKGLVGGYVIKTGNIIPIVDIQILHSNHRYYSNGVSSHNTNVGKSLCLCHFSSGYLTSGKNVLYISLEMSEEETAMRIDANLLNTPIDKLESLSKEQYTKLVERVKSKTIGKLIIKQFPTAAAGVGHFRVLMNELRLKKNFTPDIVVIDYMNICCSSRLKMGGSVNSYTYVKAIAEEFRGLAVEYNIPIITASQLNRSGGSSSDPNVEDISESHGTSMTADFIAAIISSDELESLNQLMIKQIKSRYGDKSNNKRFCIGVDRSKMKLYDLEESAQVGLTDSRQTPIIPVSRESFGTNGKEAFKKKSFDNIKV